MEWRIGGMVTGPLNSNKQTPKVAMTDWRRVLVVEALMKKVHCRSHVGKLGVVTPSRILVVEALVKYML